LMVVIVIIGILAAIAIPKLFGMSAKAKAQEVGPTFGTWVKMQQAYKMETGKWGGNKKISFKMPGDSLSDQKSETGNFAYETNAATNADSVGTPKLEAVPKFSSDECKPASAKWTGEFKSGDEDPTMTIAGGADCEVLTPNFVKIGKKAAAAGGD